MLCDDCRLLPKLIMYMCWVLGQQGDAYNSGGLGMGLATWGSSNADMGQDWTGIRDHASNNWPSKPLQLITVMSS